MDISFGFIIVLIFILFPGLTYRRLYFYGDFSKQFSSGKNLIELIAIASIPGIINLILVFVFYNKLITNINIEEIIDKFKDINNPSLHIQQSGIKQFNLLFTKEIIPFVSLVYLSSFIFGMLSGRIIRISRLDTKFKLLRFKNYWFYLFTGRHTGFKKMKHLKIENKKYLFTKADILIESNNLTHLYSGIIVDYELQENNCKELSKVILQDAVRYSEVNGGKKPINIPGNLFVVDCSRLKNINLTYIYEESVSVLKSKIPNNISVYFGVFIILLIPFFIFRIESIDFFIYNFYFCLPWYDKILAYLLITQGLDLFNPFILKGKEYRYVTKKIIIVRIIFIAILVMLIWIF